MIDHLDDLESDFSAIHRVDDIHALDGPRFMRMAWRISTYGGVMAMRLREQEAEAHPAVVEPRQAPTPAPRPSATPSGVKPFAAAAATFPDIFDTRRAV